MRFLEKSSSSQPLIERAMRGRSANPGSSIKSRVFLALGGAPFSEPWALEFVPYGIRVNTVSPGSILVEGNGWDRYRLANPGYFEDYIRHGFGRSRPSPHQSAAGGAAGGVARPGDQSPSLPAAAPPAPHQGSRHGHRRDRSG